MACDLGLALCWQALPQGLTSGAGRAFLKAATAQARQALAGQTGCSLGWLSQFEAIYLQDRTPLVLPAKLAELYAATGQPGGPGPKAGLKLQLTFNWLTAQGSALRLSPALVSDYKFEVRGR